MLRPSVVVVLLVLPLAARCADAQAPASAQSCTVGARKLSTNSTISNDEDHRFEWRSSGCEVKVRFSGKLRFTEDFRTIAGLERDRGFRAIESGPVDRSVEIRPGDDGALRYRYEVDGRERAFDAEGQAWLESVVLQLFRRSGYAANERVQWMLRTGGAEAVFAEMTKMDSDYGRNAYSVALLSQSSADPALQARVLASAAAWSSDYYKAELLDALTEGSRDARVAEAGWKLVRTLDSDYYATKGIQRLFSLGEPNAAQVEVAIAALDGVESDYYRAELLKSISRRAPLEGRTVPLYLKAAERTESDYYRAEMLAALVDRGPLAKEQLLAAIRATSTMKSDYYRSQSLVRIARTHELEGDTFDAYMAAADAIKSSHYHSEAVRAARRRSAGMVSY